MKKKQLEQDILFIKEMVDDLFIIILDALEGIHAKFNIQDIRMKRFEERLKRLEREVFDE